jgi:thiamine-phosphate pyrophosphorylase
VGRGEAPADSPAPALAPPPLVYLITDRAACDGRPLEDVVARALTALPRPQAPPSSLAVQVREKDLPAGALLSLARHLRALTAGVGARLFINDRVDVALAVGADGVHLTGGSMTVADVRALAPSLQIAVSTHTVDDVRAAAATGQVSFVVFGPVFDTPSKRGYGAPLGLDGLRDASAQGIPVVALGGIEADNVRGCLSHGASGIACIRAVLRNRDPQVAMSRLFGAIEST